MQLKFSKINTDDVPLIMEIENVIYPNPWASKTMKGCIKAGYQSIKVEDPAHPDSILAYAFLMIGYQESNILNIGVNPKFQRQSIGSKLLERLLLISRINQANTMWLEVRESNVAAIKLYEKHHFNVIGQRKNYYQYTDEEGIKVKEHAILMSRKIVI